MTRRVHEVVYLFLRAGARVRRETGKNRESAGCQFETSDISANSGGYVYVVECQSNVTELSSLW